MDALFIKNLELASDALEELLLRSHGNYLTDNQYIRLSKAYHIVTELWLHRNDQVLPPPAGENLEPGSRQY